MFEQKSLMKPSSKPRKVRVPVLEQEHELMALGASRQWPFKVLGVAPVPSAPVFHRNWWLLPVADDHSEIPAHALERVQAIYAAGIRPKAFVIAHEAPAQLPAPTDMPRISRLEVWSQQMEVWSQQMIEHSVTAIRVIGTGLVTVVGPLTLALIGAGVLVGLGVVSAILTDPCLIAVTDDDVWIQVDSWMA